MPVSDWSPVNLQLKLTEARWPVISRLDNKKWSTKRRIFAHWLFQWWYGNAWVLYCLKQTCFDDTKFNKWLQLPKIIILKLLPFHFVVHTMHCSLAAGPCMASYVTGHFHIAVTTHWLSVVTHRSGLSIINDSNASQSTAASKSR